jgi:DNA-binding NtrC family response regulator
MIPCLFVAGDRQVRDVVKVGLEQAGAFALDMADDAWAIEMVRARRYQVVIADSTLADGSDGLDFLTEVRNALPDAELLLVARGKAQGRLASRDKQKLGVYAAIAFPVDSLEFFRTLGRLLDRLGHATARAAS